MPAEPTQPNHCVLIPFYHRLEQVARCVDRLLLQSRQSTTILLVNDGSPRQQTEQSLSHLLQHPQIRVLHHDTNRGVAAARNTAVDWCRQNDTQILLMIDSDCQPGDDFIDTHLQLHQQYPDAACIGGAVIGQGQGVWAKLDRIMSWVHSVPFGEVRAVKHPYHLPTTNFSLKMTALPPAGEAFDARLQSGEDALLIRNFRRRGLVVLFSPHPVIYHQDRENVNDVIRHHYLWGYHQYFVQLGGDLSARCFHPVYRAVFLTLFLPCLPLFALAGSALNLLPWLKHKPTYFLFYPAMYLLWLAKGIAVAEAALRPQRCLRSDT